MIKYWLTTNVKFIFAKRGDSYSAARLNDFVHEPNEEIRIEYLSAHRHPVTGAAFLNDLSPRIRTLASCYCRDNASSCDPQLNNMVAHPRLKFGSY